MIRRIMHVDMDAFYASVEQADHPHLKGKPVIIGASLRGVVSAASYEARAYGVRSAMPVFEARKRCPHGVFLPVRMARYREISHRIMGIFHGIAPLVEQVSIDEAFLDISGTDHLHGPPQELAAKIKQEIFEKTSLTCSIGIAPNKFLAKIASDLHKPDGLTIVQHEDVPALLRRLPVSRLPGIGAKTASMLESLGVATAGSILDHPESFWVRRLGVAGTQLYRRAQGRDDSQVTPDTPPKSCSAEDTFPQDTDNLEEVRKWLLLQAESVGRDLRAQGIQGRTVVLKVKYSDFKLVTRSRTLAEPTNCTQTIFETAWGLLTQLPRSRKLRLVGVGVGNFQSGPRQGKLFLNPSVLRSERLDSAVDEIRRRYGDKLIKRGLLVQFDP